MTEEELFDRIAILLQTQHVYSVPIRYMRRWGPRTPGNGRFPGYGIVRIFAPDQIHVAFHTPAISRTFKSFEETLAGVAEILTRGPKLVL